MTRHSDNSSCLSGCKELKQGAITAGLVVIAPCESSRHNETKLLTDPNKRDVRTNKKIAMRLTLWLKEFDFGFTLLSALTVAGSVEQLA